jgi:modulator of FtsH protease HflC
MRAISAIIVLVVVLIVANSVFIVREGQSAVLLEFGRIENADLKPGLHFNIPIVQQVIKFDRRIITLEAPPERYFTSEKKSANVDFFVKWRIDDPGAFYRAFGATELEAGLRLAPIVKDALRFEFNSRPLHDLIAGGRTDVTENVRKQANAATESKLGIHIVDVRIKRIELPDEVSKSIYARMRAERVKVANSLRAEGKESSITIIADADRQVQVLKAEATKLAQQARGEGDGRAAEVYAGAYGKDPEFYAFYRSLEAYRETFKANGSVFVLDPKSEFLRYFGESK